MITSDVGVCNLALDWCNTRNITSLNEDTKESKKCDAWYDLIRKSLLTNLNASFAIKRAKLAEDLNYTEVYGYKKAYSLPNDCLHVLNLGSPVQDTLYQIEGEHFLCDIESDDVYIRYIADIKDVTKFDAEFIDLLALKLAERICVPLTEDLQQANYLKQLAQQKYVECSSKYGNDNRITVINKPLYREAKINSEILDYNYPLK